MHTSRMDDQDERNLGLTKVLVTTRNSGRSGICTTTICTHPGFSGRLAISAHQVIIINQKLKFHFDISPREYVRRIYPCDTSTARAGPS